MKKYFLISFCMMHTVFGLQFAEAMNFYKYKNPQYKNLILERDNVNLLKGIDTMASILPIKLSLNIKQSSGKNDPLIGMGFGFGFTNLFITSVSTLQLLDDFSFSYDAYISRLDISKKISDANLNAMNLYLQTFEYQQKYKLMSQIMDFIAKQEEITRNVKDNLNKNMILQQELEHSKMRAQFYDIEKYKNDLEVNFKKTFYVDPVDLQAPNPSAVSSKSPFMGSKKKIIKLARKNNLELNIYKAQRDQASLISNLGYIPNLNLVGTINTNIVSEDRFIKGLDLKLDVDLWAFLKQKVELDKSYSIATNNFVNHVIILDSLIDKYYESLEKGEEILKDHQMFLEQAAEYEKNLQLDWGRKMISDKKYYENMTSLLYTKLSFIERELTFFKSYFALLHLANKLQIRHVSPIIKK